MLTCQSSNFPGYNGDNSIIVIGLLRRHCFASSTVYSFDLTQYDAQDVIVRDIAVIGGGSSGTYGAVNLHAIGQSVILVEKEALLGGHINTYTDPTTGVTVDYGVQAFWNSTTTWDYFELLGISGEVYSIAPLTNVFYDFSTGAPVTVQKANNFTAYAQQLDKYPYLANSWDLPNPLPEDLVLPFQNFVTKYNLANMAYTIYFNSQGLTNFLQQLTINVFKMFDSTLLSGLIGHDVVPPNHNNKLIFEMALEKLGASNVSPPQLLRRSALPMGEGCFRSPRRLLETSLSRRPSC